MLSKPRFPAHTDKSYTELTLLLKSPLRPHTRLDTKGKQELSGHLQQSLLTHVTFTTLAFYITGFNYVVNVYTHPFIAVVMCLVNSQAGIIYL